MRHDELNYNLEKAGLAMQTKRDTIGIRMGSARA
jgi:hypothetical protein